MILYAFFFSQSIRLAQVRNFALTINVHVSFFLCCFFSSSIFLSTVNRCLSVARWMCVTNYFGGNFIDFIFKYFFFCFLLICTLTRDTKRMQTIKIVLQLYVDWCYDCWFDMKFAHGKFSHKKVCWLLAHVSVVLKRSKKNVQERLEKRYSTMSLKIQFINRFKMCAHISKVGRKKNFFNTNVWQRELMQNNKKISNKFRYNFTEQTLITNERKRKKRTKIKLIHWALGKENFVERFQSECWVDLTFGLDALTGFITQNLTIN